MEYTVKTNERGTFWFKKGADILHREDGPAIEFSNGSKFWYLNGKLHREDGPVIELANGDKWWYRNGKLHREDGPAIELADGNKFWYRNSRRVNPPQTDLQKFLTDLEYLIQKHKGS